MLVREAAGHLIRTSVQREDLNKMYRNNMISIIPLQIFPLQITVLFPYRFLYFIQRHFQK